MGRAEPVELARLLIHQMVVVLFFLAHGEAGAALVATVGDIGIAQADACIEGPLATLAEAVLPADVDEAGKHFCLVALGLPLHVTIAATDAQTDMPAVEGMVVAAVTQPAAQLDGAVDDLVGVGIAGERPPGEDSLDVDAPAVAAVE